MAHLARPKRATEDFARSHHADLDNSEPSKKPRFDVRNPSTLAPELTEDDGVLHADVIGSRGQQVRRSAVNIDGYDSDSENEGFDAQAAAKSKAKKKAEARRKDEEDTDMFADLEDDFGDGDDSEGDEKRKVEGEGKKAVRFLDTNEIEGQVSSSKSGGHVSANFNTNIPESENGIGDELEQSHDEAQSRDQESSSESDVDDATRDAAGDSVDEELGAGAKKMHAPKLDAFNMRSEQEEGRFDEQGTYVRKAADPDAVHDTWLAGLSKKDLRQAKEAADKREQEKRRFDMEKDALATSDALRSLILRLEKAETVLEALARLGKSKDKKPRWQKNRNRKPKENGLANRSVTSSTNADEVDAADATRKSAVESITESADLLLERDHPEIYDTPRELLVRQWQRETGEEWVDLPPPASLPPQQSSPTSLLDQASEPSQNVPTDNDHSISSMWQYRWSDARDGGEVHGPYEREIMEQWNRAGYFGEGVEFRRVDDTRGWSRVADF